jgi:hypothetical protein
VIRSINYLLSTGDHSRDPEVDLNSHEDNHRYLETLDMRDREIAALVAQAATVNGKSLSEFLADADRFEDIDDSERSRRREVYMDFMAKNLEGSAPCRLS